MADPKDVIYIGVGRLQISANGRSMVQPKEFSITGVNNVTEAFEQFNTQFDKHIEELRKAQKKIVAPGGPASNIIVP